MFMGLSQQIVIGWQQKLSDNDPSHVLCQLNGNLPEKWSRSSN